MKKSTIIWLIIAASLVISGALIFTLALCQTNWDFTSLSTTEFTTATHEINEEFREISIDTVTSEVTILPSPDGKCMVECYDHEGAMHTVKIENGKLEITFVDSRKWYERIGINFESAYITIYLPDSFNGEISVESTTGDVNVKNISSKSLEIDLTTGDILLESVSCAENLELELTTGKTTLKNLNCRALISDGGSGDISLENVIAQDKFEIERTPGDVIFVKCDAPDISVNTNTGDIIGTLLSEKSFSAHTSTGNVSVPKTGNGGICLLITTTGDIQISIAK